MGKHIVLVGGGHVHLQPLLRLRDYIKRGNRVTLISPSAYHYYSGMGPGMLSGLYEPRQIRFHIRKMAMDRGGTFIEDEVVRIDPHDRLLYLKGGKEVPYDLASFNTGSGIPLDGVDLSDERTIPVKPVVNLCRAYRSILKEMEKHPLQVIVVGGGPAGVEIAGNAWKLIKDNGGSPNIALISGGRLLQNHPPKMRDLALYSLVQRGILVMEDVKVRSAGEGNVTLSDGGELPYDFAFFAVGVRPPGIFLDSGLPTAPDGSLLVNENLQCIEYPELFGGGDSVAVKGIRLAKVGVHAVRQAPVLHRNLLAVLRGRKLRAFKPQMSYMLILNLGNGHGLLSRSGFVWKSRLAFKLKDYIDKRFMKRFQVSGELLEES